MPMHPSEGSIVPFNPNYPHNDSTKQKPNSTYFPESPWYLICKDTMLLRWAKLCNSLVMDMTISCFPMAELPSPYLWVISYKGYDAS